MKDILYFNTVEDIRLIDMLRVLKEHDYSKDYLTFEALEDGTFTLSIPASVDPTYMTSISYSTDDGETWTTTTVDNTAQTITTPTINAGDKALWKGVGKQMAKLFSAYSYFSSTGNFNVSGNIMSLLYGDEFANQEALPSDSMYNFCNLFRINKLTSARNLILPATTLVDSCYREMFQGCASLTTAPELPATTLAQYCYASMFNGCTSLTAAPELPAVSLQRYCYSNMFAGCTSLNYIKMMAIDIVTDWGGIEHQTTYDTTNWVQNVAASGTFVKNTSATWNVTGNNGVPSGWTVEIADS